jgi:hypothetical protein
MALWCLCVGTTYCTETRLALVDLVTVQHSLLLQHSGGLDADLQPWHALDPIGVGVPLPSQHKVAAFHPLGLIRASHVGFT